MHPESNIIRDVHSPDSALSSSATKSGLINNTGKFQKKFQLNTGRPSQGYSKIHTLLSFGPEFPVELKSCLSLYYEF